MTGSTKFSVVMVKIRKVCKLFLVLGVAGILTYSCAYASCLRVPVGIDPNRSSHALEIARGNSSNGFQIRFAGIGEAKRVSDANNRAWDDNTKLYVTPDEVRRRIKRDPRSCVVYESSEKGILSVLWLGRIHTGGYLDSIEPGGLWDRVTSRPLENRLDTIICYSVGVVPEARGKNGNNISGKLIAEAKNIALREEIKYVSTLSPTPKFDQFVSEYGNWLRQRDVPESLWPYAYLICTKAKGFCHIIDTI